MDLVKKKLELSINKQDYVMTFDMRSIAIYKELTGKFFSKGVAGLFNEDDEEILYFIASTLREKENEDEPLGEKVLKGDILFYIFNFKYKAIDLVALSLPTGEEDTKKK